MAKVYLDVGTHDGGGFDEIVDKLGITTEWKIFAFEPQPYAAALYLDVLNNGKLKRFKDHVTFIQKAAWIEDTELPMYKEIHNVDWYAARPGKKEEFLKWQHELAEEKGHLWNPPKPLAVTKHYIDGKYALGGNTLAPIRQHSNDRVIGDEHDKTWAENTDMVQCIDFSNWIRQNLSQTDEITLKIDIEGSEFPVLEKMINDGTMNWIDTLIIEWHHHMYPAFTPSYNAIMQWLQNNKRIDVKEWC